MGPELLAEQTLTTILKLVRMYSVFLWFLIILAAILLFSVAALMENAINLHTTIMLLASCVYPMEVVHLFIINLLFSRNQKCNSPFVF
jgi:hypothetical protein